MDLEAAPTDPPVAMPSPASDRVGPTDLPTEIQVTLPPTGGGDDQTVVSGNAQLPSPSPSPTC
jgi:hypothetical protein